MVEPLRRKAESVGKEIHPNTPNSVLTKQQAETKLHAQKKEINNTKRKLDRLQARMQLLLSKEGVNLDNDVSKDLDDILKEANLSEAQSLFLQQQLKASNAKKACGRRWHPCIISFALSIYMKGPSAYKKMIETGMLILPSTRTLFDYAHVQPAKEGIDKYILEDAAKKVEKLSKEETYKMHHVLMCDEMYICKNLVYQKSTGEIVGFANLSEVKEEMDSLQSYLDGKDEKNIPAPAVASKVLSFLIRGVASDVKVVVASYAVDLLTKEQLYAWSWEVIAECEAAGIAIIAFVMDGSPVNRAFIKMHIPATHEGNVIFDTVNKSAPERNLYFIADLPHLMKTIRNCFLSSTGIKYVKKNGKIIWKRCLQKNGQMILWKTIVRLYYEEKDNTLRQGFKLNATNVFPNSYSRMNCRGAFQVLSQTTVNLLREKGWPNTEETINFIYRVNKFGDQLNGNYFFEGSRKANKNLDPYRSKEDDRFGELLGFLDYLNEWKADAEKASHTVNTNLNESTARDPDDPDNSLEQEMQDENDETPAGMRQLSYQTLEGIEITVRGFIGAVKFLLDKGMKAINARVFCQNPIEQYFSKQRGRCGGSTNPNVRTYLSNAQSIYVQGQVGSKRSFKRGNTEEIDENMQISYEPLPKRKSLFSL